MNGMQRRYSILAAGCAGLVALAAAPARAQSQAGGLPAVTQRVATLEAAVAALEAQVAMLQKSLTIRNDDPSRPALTVIAAPGQAADVIEVTDAAGNRLASVSPAGQVHATSLRYGTGSCLLTEPSAGTCDVTSTAGTTSLSVDGAALPLGALAHLTSVGDDLYFSQANVHVVNGMGTTDTINGLGNLIVGYNELRGSGDDRSGSHMLVAGKHNNFKSYGGVVFGYYNETTGGYSCVTGGALNRTSGAFWGNSVSGGWLNTAGGLLTSITGGALNETDGSASTVSGGYANKAAASYAWVGGGHLNTAAGVYSSAAGGRRNAATNNWSSVTGGQTNTASATFATVSGGCGSEASGSCSSVSGGSDNKATTDFTSVSGACNQTASISCETKP